MDTKALPTTVLAVDVWLREQVAHVVDAKPGSVYYCENVYAYLYGMAIAKLAEANTAIEETLRRARVHGVGVPR